MSDNQKTTYKVLATCCNCGKTATVQAKTGTPITKVPCPHCGCRCLQTVIEQT